MKSNFLKVVVSAMFLISSIIIPTQANAACDRPSQLLATTNGSTVSFTWSGNGTGYLIEVENISTNQKVIPESNASSPHSATLTNGSYKFKIRTLCGNDKSNWSDWVSFSVGSTGPNTPGGGTGGTCTVPTQLAASTTTTGASLSWTGTAAAYQIEVENTATDINVVPEQSAASPFAVNLPAGSYKFKVRSVCGGDHSDWSPTFAFTIGTTAPNPPGGGTGGTCTVPTQLAASTTTTGASLSWTGTAASYQIEVENTATDINVVPEQSAASPFAVNLPAGSYKFKVRSVCGSDHSDWSPTFAFTIGTTGPNPPSGGGTGSTCTTPTQLAASTTTTGASLSWIGTAAAYQIEVENTATDVNVVPEQSAASPFAVNLPAGAYKFKVRSVCGGDHSDWSPTFAFTIGSTGPNPPAGGGNGSTCTVPTQLAASTTTTGASLSWAGSAASYQIEVENTATDINVVPEQSTASPFAVNLPAGSYKFKVRSVCGGDHSDWSPTFAFTIGSTGPNPPGGGTGGTCTIPTQLAASTTTTGASLSWTGTAVSYQIEVENTATDVKVVPEQSAASPFDVNLPAGSYKFKVRSVCGADHSDWSPTFAFTIGTTGPNPPGGGTGGTCTVPTQLASSVSGQEVKLSWIGTASSFQIEIENVENGSTIVAEQTTTNPYFNSFIEGRYKFKVRSLCDGDKSDWSAWSSFLINSGTSAPGNDPTVKIDTTCTNQVSLSILNAKDTSLTLKWQSAGAGVKYNIEVESEETVTKFRFKQEDYKDTSIVINGLIPNTQYKISITINCGNGISTKTNVVQSVTPLVNPTTNTGGGLSKFACDIPTGLSVQIDAAGILFSWLPSAGARSYQIELESQGNTPAFKRAIAVSSTFFLFNTTLAAGNYKVKVRPSCLSGKGAWSPAVSFTLSQAIAIKSAIENRSVNTGLEMEVYPNPATSSINLKTNNKYGFASSGLVQIINFQGQVVQEFRNFDLNSNQKIGIQNLVPGIYYIKLDTEYSQNIKKLIVN